MFGKKGRFLSSLVLRLSVLDVSLDEFFGKKVQGLKVKKGMCFSYSWSLPHETLMKF